MTDSGELYTRMEVDGDLSSAMGTEAFADRDLIPPSFDNAAKAQTINSFILQFLFGLSILLLYLQCPANARESSVVPKNC
jgi:hypothetical protein